MSAPHSIPEEEYKSRVRKLMKDLIPRGRTNSSAETDELFLLYNDRMTPEENGKHCSKCRTKVFQRMKAYYETIKEA